MHKFLLRTRGLEANDICIMLCRCDTAQNRQ